MGNQNQSNDKEKSGKENFSAQNQGTQNSDENSASGANKGNPGQYNEKDANTGSQPGNETRSSFERTDTERQDFASGSADYEDSGDVNRGNTIDDATYDSTTSRGLREDEAFDEDDEVSEA